MVHQRDLAAERAAVTALMPSFKSMPEPSVQKLRKCTAYAEPVGVHDRRADFVPNWKTDRSMVKRSPKAQQTQE